MSLHIDYFKRREFQNEIARTRSELVILRRSLDESLDSWRAYGFAKSPNPVADSLRRHIEAHESSLQRSEQEFTLYEG